MFELVGSDAAIFAWSFSRICGLFQRIKFLAGLSNAALGRMSGWVAGLGPTGMWKPSMS